MLSFLLCVIFDLKDIYRQSKPYNTIMYKGGHKKLGPTVPHDKNPGAILDRNLKNQEITNSRIRIGYVSLAKQISSFYHMDMELLAATIAFYHQYSEEDPLNALAYVGDDKALRPYITKLNANTKTDDDLFLNYKAAMLRYLQSFLRVQPQLTDFPWPFALKQ